MSSRFEKVILLFICLVPVAYGANYWLTPKLVGYHKLKVFFRPRCSTTFESSSWQASPFTITNGVRYAMVDDLLRRNILRGKTEAGVIQLLGEPMAQQRIQHETVMVYALCPQQVYPARSWLFPGLFGTFDNWTLRLVLSNNTFVSAEFGQ